MNANNRRAPIGPRHFHGAFVAPSPFVALDPLHGGVDPDVAAARAAVPEQVPGYVWAFDPAADHGARSEVAVIRTPSGALVQTGIRPRK